MAYDYDRLFQVIIGAVQLDGSIGERMRLVVAECERQHPHPEWANFRMLDYSADAEAMSRWLPLALSGTEFDGAYQGLWFGLNNPVRDDVATADLYASATEGFDSASLDWATSPTVNLEQYELESAVLASVYELAYSSDGGLDNQAEYPIALAYGAIASCEVLAKFTPKAAFGGLRGAAAGFDSGDFLYLGEFNNGRFRKHVVAG